MKDVEAIAHRFIRALPVEFPLSPGCGKARDGLVRGSNLCYAGTFTLRLQMPKRLAQEFSRAEMVITLIAT
jgi:hypothetical protein